MPPLTKHGVWILTVAAALGCGRREATMSTTPVNPPAPLTPAVTPAAAPVPAGPLQDVDLGDDWAPFILQDASAIAGDGPKPNAYRATFVELANERATVDGGAPRRGEHNYLEVFGIPPTLSVLRARLDEDAQPEQQACYRAVDGDGLRAFTGTVAFLDRERAKREYQEAMRDADWIERELGAHIPFSRQGTIELLREEPKARARVDRTLRGQARLRAVHAAQARLVCEGLLGPGGPYGRTRFTGGMFDLPTHEALADWERKNDIFGWGFLGGETAAGLLRAPDELHLQTFKRILAERAADAAGIIEDGSAARAKAPATFTDGGGVARPLPNLIAAHTDALATALGVATPADLGRWLRARPADAAAQVVRYPAPPLPPYYAAEMDLSVEIDRGDVWYDFPFDAQGKPLVQRREHFPHLTLFVDWNRQRIPLGRWRTTIGSWRSEVQADGRVYMKYKNSDVGPRLWKNIVASPVWIPPETTPVKDLLVRKVLDRAVGPVTVVNTDVMGPGFQSAYGMVMAIHIDPKRGGFDNQVRTHGSVDYTSIAQRFSHGCHRLVNNRAVRMFDFVLRRRRFVRQGNYSIDVRRRFVVDGEPYAFQLKTRGYYYELQPPVPVVVTEGRIMGVVTKPIASYVRKPGVDYGSPSSSDAATSMTPPRPTESESAPPSESAPDIGP
ncbi:MAG TPA: hypothetical protein VH374_10845 [Polyangia bacterium]|nr:hypothetical protein [Polyangia bacterium]